ncbi:hypothetical protein OQA88_11090 [Cercophora sp. LCS_1]
MNPSSKTNPERSHVGPKETGGLASAVNTPATSGLGVDKPKAFDAAGKIGKQFTEEGKIGRVGEKIGGPMSSEGMIGKQFTEQGSIGGTVEKMMGGNKTTHS